MWNHQSPDKPAQPAETHEEKVAVFAEKCGLFTDELRRPSAAETDEDFFWRSREPRF